MHQKCVTLIKLELLIANVLTIFYNSKIKLMCINNALIMYQ